MAASASSFAYPLDDDSADLTLYVSGGGSNSNAGTAAAPVQTIEYALSLANTYFNDNSGSSSCLIVLNSGQYAMKVSGNGMDFTQYAHLTNKKVAFQHLNALTGVSNATVPVIANASRWPLMYVGDLSCLLALQDCEAIVLATRHCDQIIIAEHPVTFNGLVFASSTCQRRSLVKIYHVDAGDEETDIADVVEYSRLVNFECCHFWAAGNAPILSNWVTDSRFTLWVNGSATSLGGFAFQIIGVANNTSDSSSGEKITNCSFFTGNMALPIANTDSFSDGIPCAFLFVPTTPTLSGSWSSSSSTTSSGRPHQLINCIFAGAAPVIGGEGISGLYINKAWASDCVGAAFLFGKCRDIVIKNSYVQNALAGIVVHAPSGSDVLSLDGKFVYNVFNTLTDTSASLYDVNTTTLGAYASFVQENYQPDFAGGVGIHCIGQNFKVLNSLFIDVAHDCIQTGAGVVLGYSLAGVLANNQYDASGTGKLGVVGTVRTSASTSPPSRNASAAPAHFGDYDVLITDNESGTFTSGLGANPSACIRHRSVFASNATNFIQAGQPTTLVPRGSLVVRGVDLTQLQRVGDQLILAIDFSAATNGLHRPTLLAGSSVNTSKSYHIANGGSIAFATIEYVGTAQDVNDNEVADYQVTLDVVVQGVDCTPPPAVQQFLVSGHYQNLTTTYNVKHMLGPVYGAASFALTISESTSPSIIFHVLNPSASGSISALPNLDFNESDHGSSAGSGVWRELFTMPLSEPHNVIAAQPTISADGYYAIRNPTVAVIGYNNVARSQALFKPFVQQEVSAIAPPCIFWTVDAHPSCVAVDTAAGSAHPDLFGSTRAFTYSGSSYAAKTGDEAALDQSQSDVLTAVVGPLGAIAFGCYLPHQFVDPITFSPVSAHDYLNNHKSVIGSGAADGTNSDSQHIPDATFGAGGHNLMMMDVLSAGNLSTQFLLGDIDAANLTDGIQLGYNSFYASNSTIAGGMIGFRDNAGFSNAVVMNNVAIGGAFVSANIIDSASTSTNIWYNPLGSSFTDPTNPPFAVREPISYSGVAIGSSGITASQDTWAVSADVTQWNVCIVPVTTAEQTFIQGMMYTAMGYPDITVTDGYSSEALDNAFLERRLQPINVLPVTLAMDEWNLDNNQVNVEEGTQIVFSGLSVTNYTGTASIQDSNANVIGTLQNNTWYCVDAAGNIGDLSVYADGYAPELNWSAVATQDSETGDLTVALSGCLPRLFFIQLQTRGSSSAMITSDVLKARSLFIIGAHCITSDAETGVCTLDLLTTHYPTLMPNAAYMSAFELMESGSEEFLSVV